MIGRKSDLGQSVVGRFHNSFQQRQHRGSPRDGGRSVIKRHGSLVIGGELTAKEASSGVSPENEKESAAKLSVETRSFVSVRWRGN